MSDIMEFANREDFRNWLNDNFDAKTDAGREKRLAWIADRLNKNLRPM